MESSPRHFQYILYGIVPLVAILGTWEWAVRMQYISSLALPLPSAVLTECVSQLTSPAFLSNWSKTLTVWSISLLFGLTTGLLLGFASGSSRAVALTLLPLLGYFRSVPPIALFPIALVAMGPGNIPIGLVATVGAALYVFPGTAEAARQTANRFVDLATILGANRIQFLVKFVAPGAALHALASSRVAATYAFAVCVAGEMVIGGRYGVGAAILDLSERYRLEEAYAYVLYTGIVGVVIDFAFARIARLRVLGFSSTTKY